MQNTLFDNPVPIGDQDFDGETYDPAKDKIRLHGQLARVTKVLMRGGWWTLGEIFLETGDPEGSISARLRDLRKDKFGAHEVERRRIKDAPGLWQYRLTLNREVEFK